MSVRRTRRRCGLAALVAALAISLSGPAMGQESEAAAERQFQLGVDRYKVGDFRSALDHFLSSNRLTPNKNVVLNIARCYEQLGQFPEAYRYYTSVISAETDPAAKERVEGLLAAVAPKVAVVRIITEPSGAILYVNRKDLGARGSSPRSLGLAAGKYTIIAELPGYQTVESAPIDAQIGSTTPITLKLARVFGDVRIEGVPGATVRADSENGPIVCTTPCETKAAPGRQTFVVQKEGYHAADLIVEVVPNETVVVRPVMMVQSGTVVITSDTKDALVSVDGKPVGLAPATLNLSVGPHRISVAQSGYTPIERDIVVRDEAAAQKVALNLGEQANELLNATTTTATRTAEKVEEAPGSVTVITRQQILDMNARSLREVLSVFVPGMEALPTSFRYGDRTEESIFSRGLLSDFSQQVLILHNGAVKYNDSTWGQPGLGMLQMTLDNIERVEISRSPIPLYGGSAVTVINIVTREQFLNGVEGNVAIGTGDRNGPVQGGIRAKNFSAIVGHDFGSWHLGAHVQLWDDNGQYHDKAAGRGEYGLRANTVTTPGANGAPPTVQEAPVTRRSLRDGTRTSGAASLNLRSNDNKYAVDVAYRKVSKDAFLSGLVTSQSNDLYVYESNILVGSVKYRPVDAVEVIIGGMRMNWENTTNFGGKPFSGNESNYHVFGDIVYRNRFTALGRHSLVTGLHVESEGQYAAEINTWTDQSNFSSSKSESLTFAPNADRQALGLYAEDQWRLTEVLSVLAGGRVDVYNGFGNKANGDTLRSVVANPRVAATFAPFKELLIKALYASAARPPSIYERAGVNLPPLAGSRNTSPERVHTVELASILRLNQLKISVTPFVQVFQDQIQYIQADPTLPTATAGNSGNTVVRGIDGDARFFLNPRNYVFVNASYLLSEDTTSGSRTLYLPSTYVNSGINLNYFNFNLNVTEWYRGPRRVPGDPTSGQPSVAPEFTGSSFWMTASLTYAVTPSIRPYLTVDNVTNSRNYVPLQGGLAHPMRSQSYWLGLNYSWR